MIGLPGFFCDYKVVEFKDYREMKKGKPFDAKTMPMVDYWQKSECIYCNSWCTETGWINEEGRRQPFGFSGNSKPCGGTKAPNP